MNIQAIQTASRQWHDIPSSAIYAFTQVAERCECGLDATEFIAELAREMGAAAARGDNVGAANIKAMLIACY